MIQAGLATKYDALAAELVRVDKQLAKTIRAQAIKGLRAKATPGAVKMYLLGLAIDAALTKATIDTNAAPAQRRARAKSTPAG